jgi:hypothetical protein
MVCYQAFDDGLEPRESIAAPSTDDSNAQEASFAKLAAIVGCLDMPGPELTLTTEFCATGGIVRAVIGPSSSLSAG